MSFISLHKRAEPNRRSCVVYIRVWPACFTAGGITIHTSPIIISQRTYLRGKSRANGFSSSASGGNLGLPPLCARRARGCCPSESPPSGEQTTLQKHVSFFDGDKDGLITLKETYEGFRALGFNPVVSGASAAFINGALGPKTKPEGSSTSFLTIHISNIHKGKHLSDTGAYDTEGRFVPEKFEEIFQKHAHTSPDILTKSELLEMLKSNKDPNDSTGWVAANAEWLALYELAKNKDGLLTKDSVRSMYDGSLFYEIQKKSNQL